MFYTKSEEVEIKTSASSTTISQIENSTIKINGKVYSGNSIQISDGQIVIDGSIQEMPKEEKEISIFIEGNCGNIVTHNGSVHIGGSANNIKTHTGSISVNSSVEGDCRTHNGNIKVKGHIKGNCRTHNGNIGK